MTGLGRKVFSAGEVLQAADVNGYLMDQSVMVFASEAARSSAIASPTAGMMSFIAASSAVNVYDGAAWTEISGGGGVTVGTAAPTPADEGDLWWDSDTGLLYVYYDDGTSQQWVDAASPKVFISDTAPTGYDGQLWLDSTDGSMYVYYTDPGGASSSWIGAVSRSGGILQVVSTTKTDTFSASVASAGISSEAMSASITPRSTSSKILVAITSSIDADGATASITLFRNGSSLTTATGDAAGTRRRVTAGNPGNLGNGVGSVTMSFLDSPSTTSSITYDFRISHNGGTTRTCTVNRGFTDADSNLSARSISTITLYEVAG